MIGTALQGVLIMGGGGNSGYKSVNITVDADANFIADAALIGALEIISILSKEAGIINQGIVFNSGSGRIAMNVYQGETFTINYTTL